MYTNSNLCTCICSELKSLSSNTGLLTVAQAAVGLSSGEAMKKPKMFAYPSIQAGLAVAMATPLSVVLRSSLSSTIVACVEGKNKKKKASRFGSLYQNKLCPTKSAHSDSDRYICTLHSAGSSQSSSHSAPSCLLPKALQL